MNALGLLQNEVYLSWCEHRRHLGQSIASTAIVTALFLGLYHGVRAAAGSEASLDGLIVGFMTWGVASAAYNAASRHVTSEAHAGTLEQLHLSPFGFRSVLLARAGVQLGSGIVHAFALTLLAMLFTGHWVAMPLGQVVLLLLLGAPSLIGMGIAIGGVAMINKRMQTVAALLNLFLIAVVSLPAYPWNPIALLPFAYASSIVRAVATGSAIDASACAIVAATSAAYLVVGGLVYSYFERKAKRTGVIGQF